MLIWDLFKMSLLSLVTHKLRSFLTALGIIIGVASVISMISIGEGARRQTLNTISKFGMLTGEYFFVDCCARLDHLSHGPTMTLIGYLETETLKLDFNCA